jgi:calcium-dependent protein kinase
MICPERERLTSSEVLNHPYITDNTKREPDTDMEKNMQAKIDNLKKFTETSLFQKIVYSSLSQRLSFKEIEDLQKIFNDMDMDNDGVISRDEFSEGLKTSNLKNNKELMELFDKIDTDQSKKINFSEFITGAIDKKFFSSKEKLLEVFMNYDDNKDGKISLKEFEKVMKMDGIDDQTFEQLKKEFEDADYDNNGYIDYEEFLNYITKSRDKIMPKGGKKSGGW